MAIFFFFDLAMWILLAAAAEVLVLRFCLLSPKLSLFFWQTDVRLSSSVGVVGNSSNQKKKRIMDPSLLSSSSSHNIEALRRDLEKELATGRGTKLLRESNLRAEKFLKSEARLERKLKAEKAARRLADETNARLLESLRRRTLEVEASKTELALLKAMEKSSSRRDEPRIYETRDYDAVEMVAEHSRIEAALEKERIRTSDAKARGDRWLALAGCCARRVERHSRVSRAFDKWRHRSKFMTTTLTTLKRLTTWHRLKLLRSSWSTWCCQREKNAKGVITATQTTMIFPPAEAMLVTTGTQSRDLILQEPLISAPSSENPLSIDSSSVETQTTTTEPPPTVAVASQTAAKAQPPTVAVTTQTTAKSQPPTVAVATQTTTTEPPSTEPPSIMAVATQTSANEQPPTVATATQTAAEAQPPTVATATHTKEADRLRIAEKNEAKLKADISASHERARRAHARSLRLAACAARSEAAVRATTTDLLTEARDSLRFKIEAQSARDDAAVSDASHEASRVAMEAALTEAQQKLERARAESALKRRTEVAAHQRVTAALENRAILAEAALTQIKTDRDALATQLLELQQNHEGALKEDEENRSNNSGADRQRAEFFKRDNAQLSARVGQLEEALRKADSMRRTLHNSLQELKGNVRVVARVRPSVDGKKNTSVTTEGSAVVVNPGSRVGVDGSLRATKPQYFTFDRVFGPDAHQAEVFKEIEELVQSSIDGYHVCILAAGATGAGKSHTMYADGVVQRAATTLAAAVRALETQGWQHTLDASCVEVYEEKIYDLLPRNYRQGSSSGPALELRDRDASSGDNLGDEDLFTVAAAAAAAERQHGSGPVVEGVARWRLDPADPNEISRLVERAALARRTRATAVHDRSSRSHSVFTLRVRGHHAAGRTATVGSLVLVDLAGSERIAQSGAAAKDADPSQFREACAINKSLSCLVDVFASLERTGTDSVSRKTKQQQLHVPYRNSKLTHLLQNALSSNGKALLIAAVSPELALLPQTVCTLRFAAQVGRVNFGRPTKHAMALR